MICSAEKAAKLGTEAKVLLNTPLLKQFFEIETARAYQAFADLDAAAGLEQYQHIKFYLCGIERLKLTLQNYVYVWEQDGAEKLEKQIEPEI